jgi:hypothetical protein
LGIVGSFCAMGKGGVVEMALEFCELQQHTEDTPPLMLMYRVLANVELLPTPYRLLS